MASPCRAIVPLGTCVCVSCAGTSAQKAWGAHRVVAGKGGDEQREPVGDGCFECMDAAAERWPHEAWGQTAARIAGSEEERRRLVTMYIVLLQELGPGGAPEPAASGAPEPRTLGGRFALETFWVHGVVSRRRWPRPRCGTSLPPAPDGDVLT